MEVKIATKSGNKTGTTTSAYVEAIRVDTRGCGQQGKTYILIKNTHATSTMYYKIDGYPYDVDGTLSGLSTAVASETSINANTQAAAITVGNQYAALVISVKQNSAAGTYQIDYVTI
jgi:hypothetical protein